MIVRICAPGPNRTAIWSAAQSVVPAEPPARMPSSRASRRAAGERALRGGGRGWGEERGGVGDAAPLVHALGVHGLRPAVFADSLDGVGVDARLVVGRVDRALGVGADDQDLGLALLEKAA